MEKVQVTTADRSQALPLVVDLDGTLVRTDLLVESVLALIRRSPGDIPRLPLWLAHGRARFKHEVARRVPVDVEHVPYREELCEFLRGERAAGRRLILASAADEQHVSQIAAHLGLFERVFASDGAVNLKGRVKRERLVQELGQHQFDYAGDARNDLPVWKAARRAILVGGPRLRAAVERDTPVERVFAPTEGRWRPSVRVLRLHHWLKNLLVFVPVLAAHRADESALLLQSGLAFLALGLGASALYVLNDLLDIRADRRHPRKRHSRPLAAGDLAPALALSIIPPLLLAAFWVALALPRAFIGVLAGYVTLSLTYSLLLKRIVLLDILVLAGLYAIRIQAGAAATGIPVSEWLLEFAMFLFLSLALLKRYTELVTMEAVSGGETEVRGYTTGDGALLGGLGAASGYLAALVFALYLASDVSVDLYRRHQLLWWIVPALIYWVSYMWLMAHRNRMPYDPVVFAVRDRTSQVLLVAMAVIGALAV